ncbi:flagellar hook-length control protein FliK [Clostridium paridis]|uniref:Flagellar hook-length control protein FliK n=1 Tax=Clostridium paridis TaxID=2803863 RepID=A0A937FJV2_9CLOT|nr:flagellar hook-length control protein FliK [Clostridium paridis]
MNIGKINFSTDINLSESKVSYKNDRQQNFKDYFDNSVKLKEDDKKADLRQVDSVDNNRNVKAGDSKEEVKNVKSTEDNEKVDGKDGDRDTNTSKEKLEEVVKKLEDLKDELAKIQKDNKGDSKSIEDLLSVINSLILALQNLKDQKNGISETQGVNGQLTNTMNLLGGQSLQNSQDLSLADIQNKALFTKVNDIIQELKLNPVQNGETGNISAEIVKLLTDMDGGEQFKDILSKLQDVVKEIPKVIVDATKDMNTSNVSNQVYITDSKVEEGNAKATDETTIKNNNSSQKGNENGLASVGKTNADATSIAKTVDVSSNADGSKEESNSESSKEDDFLQSILKGKGNDNFDKVAQLNLNRVQVPVDNVVNEAQSISKANITQDVIKTIKFMETSSLKELTVKMNPKDLGEITIKLVAQGEQMKATINASNKEAYDLLNSKVQEIKNTLNTQNIKIDDVNVSLNDNYTAFSSGQESFGAEKGNDGRSNSSGKTETPEITEITDETEETLLYNNLNKLA